MALQDEDAARKNRSASIKNLTTAKLLADHVKTLQRARQSKETEWKLNLAFFRGDQYKYWNKPANRIESMPTEDGEKPRYRVRVISNQVKPGAFALLAKLTKTKPMFAATPGSGSDHDIKAAQLAVRLLEYWWGDFDLTEKRDEALMWAIIAGQGFWKIEWDDQANKGMKFQLAPDGTPITQDSLLTLYESELAKFGMQVEEKVVYMGDIRVRVMSPFDVYLDPAGKVFSDAKYAYCRHFLSVDEVKSRYNKDVVPDAVASDYDQQLPTAGTEGASTPTLKVVYEGYFVPQPALPQGRYVVFTDNEILKDGPWPYPFQKLPLVKFPGLRVPGSVYDDAVISGVRPLQKELNRTLSQILEWKNLTVRPQWTAPVGSLRQRMNTAPGAIWEYIPMSGFRPEPVPQQGLPAQVFEILNDIGARIKDQFGLTEFSEGQAFPSHMDSGIAVDLMQEMASDRLSPWILLIEGSLGRAGELMLALAQEYYVEERTLRIKGTGGATQVKRFSRADITGVDVGVEAGSGIPRTRGGRQERIYKLLELQVIPPHVAMKHLDLADMEGIMSSIRADEDQALREHDKIIEGKPLNLPAQLAAQNAVMAGVNPDTGEEIRDEAEAQSILERAALQPGPYDNHEQHMDTHGQFVKSIEFESLPPEVQRMFFMHAELTIQMMQMPPEAVDPRVSLQIKSTAGPTATSEVLKRAGVEVTPETLTEPPLETWVSDSIDKPDMDSAGNDPLTDQDMQLQALQAEQKLKQSGQQHGADMAIRTATLAKKLAEQRLASKKADLGP